MAGATAQQPSKEIERVSDGKSHSQAETKIREEGFFLAGRIRIKITEHFTTQGRPLNELIADLVIHEAKDKMRQKI